MSSKRKNAPRTNLPKRSPKTPPAVLTAPDVPKSPEMSANVPKIENSDLTFRQQSALPVVAVSRTLAQAARDSGIAEKTLRRWLQEAPFRDELDRLRKESYRMARNQLQASLPHCIAMLADIAAESDDPAIRLRAIRTLLTYGVKFGDFDKLADDLHDLRATLLEGK